ncbi:MAG TPA: sigma-54 dependent transcriptional regulator [bacterium]|nr:sigma-54 dependent transcriptional regulator [bacterium]
MAGERILVVEDEEGMREFLRILLTKEGYDVLAFEEGSGALEAFKDENFHVVITDIKMPGMDGMEVLARVKEIDPSIPVIIMTGHGSMETAIEAVNRDAFAYLLKQARNDEIKQLVKKAVEMRLLQKENRLLKQQLKKSLTDRPTIGKSQKIRQVFALVDKVAETDSTILIYGESGTGKELVAREIHTKSCRTEGPFVSINCGALPETLLESELFGHVRGSFTGAVRDKDGLFAVAKGGTFFLDEVGETSSTIQVKLLRVLQEREIIPVGGVKPIKVDVRLIAATNADLERDVETGKFRADLFYRLNVIPIRIPPLRERKDDIPLLVEHFLKIYSQGGARPIKTVSPEALDMLMRYDWPGNVRELENALERAVILQEGRVIMPEDLPEKLRSRNKDKTDSVVSVTNLTLDELEKEYLLKVLEETGWHKKRAASILGINASTLYRKLQRYGFEKAVAALRPSEEMVGSAKSDQ